jgi:hypothetical protein
VNADQNVAWRQAVDAGQMTLDREPGTEIAEGAVVTVIGSGETALILTFDSASLAWVQFADESHGYVAVADLIPAADQAWEGRP